MPCRLKIVTAARTLPIRFRASSERSRPAFITTFQQRQYSADIKKDLPVSDTTKRTSTQTAPHVSEEAAAISDVMGTEGPDLNQGTPVEEIVQGDEEAQRKLPKVMKDAIQNGKPINTRSFSTSAIVRNDQEHVNTSESIESTIIGSGTSMMQSPADVPTKPVNPGLKFGLPELPIPSDFNLHHRYDPIIEQLTGLMIRHGKKGVAQRNVSLILSHLRTSSPPTLSRLRPLLPGHPPPSHLPLNPILYLTLAIDSIAPLLRIRQMRGAAGGGVALQIPVPLGLRQRRRKAITWILESASNRKSRGSGRGMFAQRIAETMVNVVEGKSDLWQKRELIHKQGVAARANMSTSLSKRPRTLMR